MKNIENLALKVFCLLCILSQSVQAEGNFVESDLFGSLKEGGKAAVLDVTPDNRSSANSDPS